MNEEPLPVKEAETAAAPTASVSPASVLTYEQGYAAGKADALSQARRLNEHDKLLASGVSGASTSANPGDAGKKTPQAWMDALAMALIREGVGKHAARSIAMRFWEAYCDCDVRKGAGATLSYRDAEALVADYGFATHDEAIRLVNAAYRKGIAAQ